MGEILRALGFAFDALGDLVGVDPQFLLSAIARAVVSTSQMSRLLPADAVLTRHRVRACGRGAECASRSPGVDNSLAPESRPMQPILSTLGVDGRLAGGSERCPNEVLKPAIGWSY